MYLFRSNVFVSKKTFIFFTAFINSFVTIILISHYKAPYSIVEFGQVFLPTVHYLPLAKQGIKSVPLHDSQCFCFITK